MAALAVRARRDVVGGFAVGDGAVVTGRAGAGDASVVEACGVQAVVVWQCRTLPWSGCGSPVLPSAIVPLWQLAQVPVTWVWSTRAGSQAVVVWQLRQFALDAMWSLGLPSAIVPLWQLAQVPVTWV